MLLDGLKWRLEQDDPRYPTTPDISYYDNTVLQELAEKVAEILKARSASSHGAAVQAPTPAKPLEQLAPLEEVSAPLEAPSAELSPYRNTVIPEQPQRPIGRPVGGMRQRITTLLAQHPEGLTAEQIRANLNAERPIGDTLQGMRRGGIVQVLGEGRQRRYVIASQQAR